MFLTADATCIEATESQSRTAIQQWLERAGMEGVSWPISRTDAAKLLHDGGEYSVDPERLAELGKRGQVPAVEFWDCKDILAAASALEGRRDWRVSPSIHDGKKHLTRLAIERTISQDPERGFSALLAQLGGLDLELALVLMCECNNREVRERLLSNIQILLAAEEAKR